MNEGMTSQLTPARIRYQGEIQLQIGDNEGSHTYVGAVGT